MEWKGLFAVVVVVVPAIGWLDGGSTVSAISISISNSWVSFLGFGLEMEFVGR